MRICTVSNDNCLAPAGYRAGGLGGGTWANTNARCGLTCFACGEPVCSKCSRKMDWYNHGKQTICDNCLEESIK